jgi:hypothetical protein
MPKDKTITEIHFSSLNLDDSDEAITGNWGKELQLVVKRLYTKLLF